MDIISSLPVELSHKILLLLSIKDLFECMKVSKDWNRVVNDNYVWGHYFRRQGIEEIGDSECFDQISGLPSLCSRAQEMKNYLRSPAYKWRYDDCTHYYIKFEYRCWKVACFKSCIAVLYWTVGLIHIYRFTQDSVLHTQTISIFAPQDVTEQFMLMNSKYLIVGFSNIFYVLTIVEGNFTVVRVYAVVIIGLLVCETLSEFSSFILENIEGNVEVFGGILVDDILWLTVISGLKYKLNLQTKTKAMFQIWLYHTKFLSKKKYIMHYRDVRVLITDVNGTTISFFTLSRASEDIFYDNVNILCVKFKVIEEKFALECRALNDGHMINTFSLPEGTKITIHPTKNILYMLSAVFAYSVRAVCVDTGTRLWIYRGDEAPHMYWSSTIYTIGKRYLFVYPSSNDDLFALFDLNGQLIYEGPFTSGILVYFSDSLMVAKEQGKLHLYVYL